jgi:hypothetical protein
MFHCGWTFISLRWSTWSRMLNEEEGVAVLLYVLKCAVVIMTLLKCSVLIMSCVKVCICDECLKGSYFTNFACLSHCRKCSFWKIKRQQYFMRLETVLLTSYVILLCFTALNGTFPDNSPFQYKIKFSVWIVSISNMRDWCNRHNLIDTYPGWSTHNWGRSSFSKLSQAV